MAAEIREVNLKLNRDVSVSGNIRENSPANPQWDYLNLLYNLEISISYGPTPREVCETVLKIITDKLQFDFAGIFVQIEGTASYELRHYSTLIPIPPTLKELYITGGRLSRISVKCRLDENCPEEFRQFKDYGYNWFFSLPITYYGNVPAFIATLDKKGENIADIDLSFLSVLASRLSNALRATEPKDKNLIVQEYVLPYHELVNMALKNSHESTLIFTDDEQIIFYNRALERLFGFNESRLRNEKFTTLFLKALPEEQVEEIMKQSCLHGWEGELTMYNSQGKPFPAVLSCSPAINRDGRLLAVFAFIRDLTAEKEMHTKLIQAKKMRTLGEMVSNIAHELNNPLTGVMGYSELLESGLEQAGKVVDSEFVIDEVRTINREARRACRIVQNLLTFARQEEPSREPLDVNSLLKDSIDLFRRSLRNENVRIHLDIPFKLPSIVGDNYMLQQVLMNILENARQAILGKDFEGDIFVKSFSDENNVYVEISDSGPGIPDNNINNIFEPFFTTKRAGEGTGLGLSIAKGIIQSHKGEITVKNNVDSRGATFFIKLPRPSLSQPRPQFQKLDVDKELFARFEKFRVLVVDDESSIRHLAKKLLPQVGIADVDTAVNGAEALSYLENKHYDLVISDIKMPVMGGIELYNRVMQDEKLRKIPFIFCTGNVLNQEIEQFLEGKNLPFLTKPFAVKTLISKVSEILSSYSVKI